MTSMAISKPPGTGGINSHAVSRSSELLSCAKTALKIAKSQHGNDDDYGGTMWWACQQPNELALCSWKEEISNSQLDGLCEDGLSLLRTMDAELYQLETLVRRRGHTNDPTKEIAASVRRLETDAKELSSLIKTGFQFPRASSQYQRHTQLIAQWLESVAQQQTSKLKEILKVRGNVLADQAQRRKLLNPQGPDDKQIAKGHANGTTGSSTTPSLMPEQKRKAPKAMDTPLFNMSPLPKPTYNYGANGSATAKGQNGTSTAPSTSSAPQTSSATSTPYVHAGYGAPFSATGAYGGGGYGGYGASSGGSSYYGDVAAGTGMRQRRPKSISSISQKERNEQEEIQAQIQMRQQQRQTEHRLQEAQQAEKTLSELGTLFSKMTNLITQQGEVLEKVEDDVEAGLAEVAAGQQEITKLYGIKKGNRGLIIKLFSLLIFLIIFMRLYKK